MELSGICTIMFSRLANYSIVAPSPLVLYSPRSCCGKMSVLLSVCDVRVPWSCSFFLKFFVATDWQRSADLLQGNHLGFQVE